VRQLLLEEHVDPSHANPAGQSALHIAAWWGHLDCLELLLQHGASWNARNSLTGATPLHCCLQSGKAKLVKTRYLACIERLLQAGADPDAKDDLGRTPLDYMEEDDMDRRDVLQLFESMKHANSPFRDLIIALHQNEEEGKDSMEAVKQQWMELTADDGVMGIIDSTDYQEGMQQLHSLLCDEMVTFVEAWIEQVEKVDLDDEEAAATIINHAFYSQRLTWILEMLMQTSKDASDAEEQSSDISSAMQLSRKKCLDLLGMALLHRYGHVHKKVGESLLDEDDALSNFAQFATLLAQFHNDESSLAAGEGTDATTAIAANNTAIENAWMTIARRNYFSLAKLWRDQLGIDPIPVVNGQGMSVLQFAARSGHVHLVQWLLESPDNDDENSKRKMEWLLQQDTQGQTALSAAQVNQNNEVVQVLQDFIDKKANSL
jgi:ankyrin repeat protein